MKYQKSAPLTLNAAAELDLMLNTGDDFGDDDEELLILGTEEDELESQAAQLLGDGGDTGDMMAFYNDEDDQLNNLLEDEEEANALFDGIPLCQVEQGFGTLGKVEPKPVVVKKGERRRVSLIREKYEGEETMGAILESQGSCDEEDSDYDMKEEAQDDELV